MQYINNFSQKRDKLSIAISSSNFIFPVFLGLLRRSISCTLFFVIYINNLSNHIVSPVTQLAADDTLIFITDNAKTSADEFNSDLKAHLNGHP